MNYTCVFNGVYNNTKILIDCGTSCKKICDGLASINSSIDEIDAILVTHEHSDHVQSLGMVSKKFNIPVYANKKTWDAMPKQKEKISEENILFFENDKDFHIDWENSGMVYHKANAGEDNVDHFRFGDRSVYHPDDDFGPSCDPPATGNVPYRQRIRSWPAGRPGKGQRKVPGGY